MTRFSWILLLSVHVSVHALEIVRNSSCVSNLGKEGDPEFDNTNFRWGPEKLEGYWNGIVTLDKLVGRGGQSDGVYFATLDCGDGHPEKVAIKRIVVKGTVCFESKAGEKRTKRRNRLPTLHKYYDECERHIELSTRQGATTNVVLEYDHQPRSRDIFSKSGFHSLFVMMPLFKGGDLWDALDADRKVKLDSKTMDQRINILAARLAYDIFRGIEQLHSKGFTHCDMKPENILLSQPDCFNSTFKVYQAWMKLSTERKQAQAHMIKSACKFMVSDFGLTRETEKLTRQDRHGTRLYMPPELGGSLTREYFVKHMKQNVDDIGWSPKGDVFAAGLVLLDVLDGLPGAFVKLTGATRNEHGEDVYGDKVKNLQDAFNQFSKWVDPDLLFLVSSALQPHPFQRPPARMAAGIAEKVFARLWSYKTPLWLKVGEVPTCLKK
eukprot:TRINITY_DN2031_c0_g1_i7.p1 TRINITY_DN2031_c0_g1~~TRINITY_DN2031_c0_g1_i7.p1  ORF type:complete len:437 (-),score=35.20 TRINITY_DN2031_c0_g1_i7:71-1381(-)